MATGGNPAGNFADRGDALRAQVKRRDRDRCRQHREDRAGLGDQIGRPVGQPRFAKQWFETGPDPEEKESRRGADNQRRGMEIGQIRCERRDDGDEILPARIDAEEIFELACRDDQAPSP